MIFPPTQQELKLGLGGAALGNLFVAIDDFSAQGVLHAAITDGCRTFDTAPHYGNGRSELRFGDALRPAARDGFVLSTKVGRLLTPDASAPREQNDYVDVLPFTQRWDYSAAGVRKSVQDSLQRLGLARLDVAFVHDCDIQTHGPAYPQVLHQVIHEALPELCRMKQEGLLRHIGLGVNDVQVCLDVLQKTDLDCLLLAGRYSLIDHSALAHLLPECERHGVRIALGGVFNSGILAHGVLANPDAEALRFNYAAASPERIAQVAAIERVGLEFQVPLRAAALQFPLAHPAIEIVMSGAQTVLEWQDSVAMMAHAIPGAFWDALRSCGLLPDAAPTPN